MPELPEVETTRRGLEPHLIGQRISGVVLRQRALRWKVPDLATILVGRVIGSIDRRSKYLLIDCQSGWLIVHLGMSGSLRLVPADSAPGKHDHIDIVFANRKALRLTDPRRFGAMLWTEKPLAQHALLRNLGPEPFAAQFDADWLVARTHGRRAAIKNLLMDNRLVCGVGNIYANESLFRAGIHPRRAAGRISRARYAKLVTAVRETLEAAIRAGGSSLRDFVHADGSPGYFQQEYFVYDRAGQPCKRCGTPVKSIRLGQRSAFYCPQCQK